MEGWLGGHLKDSIRQHSAAHTSKTDKSQGRVEVGRSISCPAILSGLGEKSVGG